MRIVEKKLNTYARKIQNKIWWKSLEKLIFPPVCGICGKLNENYLCNKCNWRLKNESSFQVDNYTTKTEFKRKHFDEHIYFFQYQGLIREQIINYKFKDNAYKYKAISKFIIKNYILTNQDVFQILNKYDVIIPAPISDKRMKNRGYNQSELIAKEIANSLGKDMVTNVLYKTKNILPQSSLNREEREANIEGAYDIKNKKLLLDKNVLLVDDIYTTGSTANECAKVLKQANTTKIGILTIAKD